MKRYLLFTGENFYPYGGWRDFKDSFKTIKASRKEATDTYCDWWQIVDSKTGEIIESN